MTEWQRNTAFREGYWTGRLDGLLNRPAAAAMGVLETQPGTFTYFYRHGYVIGLREARLELAEGQSSDKDPAGAPSARGSQRRRSRAAR